MFRNKSVDVHQFAMVPHANIPRSSFRMEKTLKTTFDGSFLYPIYCEEVLPGDTFNVSMTAFCRLATPVFPVMDNMYLETFFFFVPNRLVWLNWVRFMGEQVDGPGDSTDFLVPTVGAPAGGYPIGSIGDYFGLPTVGQVDPTRFIVNSALPFRGYNLIYNVWFRDENLVDAAPTNNSDGPDDYITSYQLRRRGKRHDYFTGCLPWPQKGGVPVSIGLSGVANVVPTADFTAPTFQGPDGFNLGSLISQFNGDINSPLFDGVVRTVDWLDPGLVADLSTATAVTINQLRTAFQIQKLLERDARGGTRYTELVRSHFGVVSPDARLQRPEYLGGGRTMIAVNSIQQNSATTITGSTTPMGSLAAFGTAVAHNHGFNHSFTEHGYVIGLANVRADLTYQQGMRRHWSRLTRYDFYFPVFAMLGEQAVLEKEIFARGTVTAGVPELDGDDAVFGYQERWAEYRYNPSEITGLFRSTAAGTIDAWHLAQRFVDGVVLNQDFIEEHVPIDRITAVGAAADGQQFLCDCFFTCKLARPMPMYSVPGLIDHF